MTAMAGDAAPGENTYSAFNIRFEPLFPHILLSLSLNGAGGMARQLQTLAGLAETWVQIPEPIGWLTTVTSLPGDLTPALASRAYM